MFMGEVYAIQIKVYDKDAAINILYTHCHVKITAINVVSFKRHYFLLNKFKTKLLTSSINPKI